MKKRVKYCDALKLISIILVIAIHVLADFRSYYLPINKTCYMLLSLADSFTRIAVPIFFIITGIFMLNKKEEISYKEFIKKRIPKLAIPFLIISVCYYVIDSYRAETSISIMDFISKFTTNNIKYHFWFMYAIITIYLFIPYLQVLVKNLKKEQLKTLIILIFVFGNLFNVINLFSKKTSFECLGSFVLPNLLMYTNYLFLGYYLYNHDISSEKRKIIYMLGIISILLLPSADIFYIDNIRDDVMYTASSVFAIFPTISIFLLFKYNYEKVKIPKTIDTLINKSGNLIFYIYMVHVLALEFTRIILLKIYVPTNFIENIILIVAIFIFTVILSYIGAVVCDKLYEFIAKKIKKVR